MKKVFIIIFVISMPFNIYSSTFNLIFLRDYPVDINPIKVIWTNDNGILVGGTDSNFKCTLIKFDNEHNLQWNKTYSELGYTKILEIKENDNYFFIAEEDKIILIDKLGFFIKSIGMNIKSMDIISDSNNMLIADIENDSSIVTIKEIDSDLETVQEELINLNIALSTNFSLKIKEYKNEGYIISTTDDSGLSDIVTTRLSKDFAIEWQVEETDLQVSNRRFSDMIISENGSIINCGYEWDYVADDHGYIQVINDTGAVVWDYTSSSTESRNFFVTCVNNEILCKTDKPSKMYYYPFDFVNYLLFSNSYLLDTRDYFGISGDDYALSEGKNGEIIIADKLSGNLRICSIGKIETMILPNFSFGTFGSPSDYYKVKFINDKIGWVVGESKTLYNTKNGGEIWDHVSLSGFPWFDVRDIFFLDDSIGWLVGYYNNVSYILRSVDGGENWEQCNIANQESKCELQEIFFVDSLFGFSTDLNSSKIYKTSNGGIDWDILYKSDIKINSSCFLTQNKCFIIGNQGDVLYTENGGTDWNKIELNTIRNLYDIYFLNNNFGWISGDSILFKTTNGGNTWDEISVDYSLSYINFLNENEGLAVIGRDVVKSEDGGLSWQIITCGAYYSGLTSSVLSNSSTGWITGYNGFFRKFYLNETAVEREINTNNNLFSFVLYQNFPNPFNPTTKIGFRIASLGFVSLKLYDILGREVATLVNEEKPAGNYQVEFSSGSGAQNLASGIYFYRLQAGSFVETKKMVLLR